MLCVFVVVLFSRTGDVNLPSAADNFHIFWFFYRTAERLVVCSYARNLLERVYK